MSRSSISTYGRGFPSSRDQLGCVPHRWTAGATEAGSPGAGRNPGNCTKQSRTTSDCRCECAAPVPRLLRRPSSDGKNAAAPGRPTGCPTWGDSEGNVTPFSFVAKSAVSQGGSTGHAAGSSVAASALDTSAPEAMSGRRLVHAFGRHRAGKEVALPVHATKRP